MSTREASLRLVVEKWLGEGSAATVRVTHFSHTRRKPWRYVCVKATRASGTFEFIFFRHDDGTWCVFPPDKRGPTMSASMMGKVSALSAQNNKEFEIAG